jgi:menaquinone-dependent protoporphyrinogen oxidase
MPTLVAYASIQGSTAEIAQRIGTVLKSKGLVIEILPIEEVSSFSKYSSAIVGSAVHNFEWIPPAQSFLHKNSSALSKIPVWAFSVGCPYTVPKRLQKSLDVENEGQKLEKEVKKDVLVREHMLFQGKFLKAHFNLSWRLFWSCIGGTYGDFRNWDEIERWADKVGDELHQLEAPPSTE